MKFLEDPGIKKKCTRCELWLPANTHYFYTNRRNGSVRNRDGFLRLRNPCRKCTDAKSLEKKRIRAGEDRERLNAAQRAKRRAERRIINKYKTEYQLYYAQELEREGLQLKRYEGFQFNRRQAS